MRAQHPVQASHDGCIRPVARLVQHLHAEQRCRGGNPHDINVVVACSYGSGHVRPVPCVVLAARSERAERVHDAGEILVRQVDAGVENGHTDAGPVRR